MTEKSQTVAIGAFVVGALLIGITLVIFALGTGFGKQREEVVMVFDGSVKGLTVGAPVALRGVQIGQVTDIDLILNTDTAELIMLVQAELNSDGIRRVGKPRSNLMEDLISRGLRAQLRPQSLLTGLLYIQLDFHPEDPPRLSKVDSPYIQVPTIPSELERFTRQVQELDLEKLAAQLQETVQGMHEFIGSEGFQALPATLTATLTAVTGLGEQLNTRLRDSGPRLDRVLDDAARTLATTNESLPRVTVSLEQSLAALNRGVDQFGEATTHLRDMLAPDSPLNYQLDQTLVELTRASRALRRLADSIEEQPGSLVWGRRGDDQ